VARAAIEGMVCGLAAGLDALVEAGVEVERILLIGGGAKLDATQRIASEVFGRPVMVVPPAEYVALGAAAQAAWAVSGERPAWELEGTSVVSSPPRPEIRSQYLAAASS
jgi:xylulokinase